MRNKSDNLTETAGNCPSIRKGRECSPSSCSDGDPGERKQTLCIAAPFPPPFGGMAVQAEKLSQALEQRGWGVQRVAVNQPFNPRFSWLQKVPFLRTVFRTILFLYALNKALDCCETVYLLSGFFDYFFWVSAPAIILIKARRKRVILSARGGAAGEYFRRHHMLVSPIMHLLDAVTAPSGFLKNEIQKTFVIPVEIIHNIADLDQFHYRERSQVAPRLLCTRNLEPIYNVACAISAFAFVRERYQDAILDIAGDGSERKLLESLCSKLGVSAAITFLGQVPHSEMQHVYANHDILINSSNEDNLPGVILEAFASGLPVVSTRVGGIPFLVEHEVTGLLVPKNDARALANAVIRLIEDPKLAKQIASEACSACLAYSPDNAVLEMERMLQQWHPMPDQRHS